MNKTILLRYLSDDKDDILNKLKKYNYTDWLNLIAQKVLLFDKTEDGRSFFIDGVRFTNMEDFGNMCVIDNNNEYIQFKKLIENNTTLNNQIHVVCNASLTEQKQLQEYLKPATKFSEICIVNGQKVTFIYLDGALLILCKDATKLAVDSVINDVICKFIAYYYGKKIKNSLIKKLNDIVLKNKENNSYSIESFDELMSDIFLKFANTNDFNNTIESYFNSKASELFNQELIKYTNLKLTLQMLLSSQKLLKSKIDESKDTLLTLRDNSKKDNNCESFKDALNKFSNVNIVRADRNTLIINIDTLLKTWSRADLKILMGNPHSFINNMLNNLPKETSLFIDIMFNKKYIPRVSQDIKLCMGDTYLAIESSTVNKMGTYDRLCNPHINYHNCFGQAKTAATNAFNLRDYDTAISQLISAVQSITVTDSIVFTKFIKMLFGWGGYDEFYTHKCLIDRDGNEHSAKELLETVYKDVTEMPNIENLIENDVAKETL